MRRQPVVEVDQRRPGADGSGAPADVDAGHPGHVDDQAAGRGPARVAVPAAARGHRDAELAHEGQARRHVVRVAAVGDAGRMQRVEPRVEQAAGHGVGGVARADQRPGQVAAQRGPVGRARRSRGRRSRGGADALAGAARGRPGRVRGPARPADRRGGPAAGAAGRQQPGSSGGRRPPQERAPPLVIRHREPSLRPAPRCEGPRCQDAAGSRIVGRCQPCGGPTGILPVIDLLAPRNGNIVELLND